MEERDFLNNFLKKRGGEKHPICNYRNNYTLEEKGGGGEEEQK